MVDNASTDGSIDDIIRAFPSVHVIRNERNRGYAAAVNQGLSAALPFQYVLLANNDVVMRDPDALARVVAYMDAHPEAAGACGRYEYPDGGFQRFYNQLPTEFDLIVSWGIGRHVTPLLTGSRSRRYYLVDADFDRPMTIEQPAFSCVLMRRSAFEAVGELDEAFPIFFNDVDYCWRWRAHGFTWQYLPDWHICHAHGHTTGRLPKLNAELAGSAMRFTLKYFRGAAAVRIRIAIVLEAAWRKLLHGDFEPSLASVWRGDLFHAEPSPPPHQTATALR
jgi:GT2 family glycosyltransferase